MSNTHNPAKSAPTLTVSQLNRQARSLLEGHFDFVWVTGEISNFAAPSSGHWYFSLKDGNAQVRCAMFKGRNLRLRFRPANGDAIRMRCRVSLYEGRGEFQLIAEYMEPAGAGALQAAFDQLKLKLQAEGLFDTQRKQAIPQHIQRLGVVTSPTGAAIHDILTVLRRRAPGITVYLLPVTVQGEGAAGEISSAIEYANRWQDEGSISLDALLVGRGGGSLEDLWAFNEEIVARAIAASSLPVVSAVGHEVDFSIADMVADQRAPTPSAGAELLSIDQRELAAQFQQLEKRLTQLTHNHIANLATELKHLQQRLKHPGYQLREQAQRLDDLEQRLRHAVTGQRQALHNQLELLSSQLYRHSPVHRLAANRKELEQLKERLQLATHQGIENKRTTLTHLARLLDSISPLRTLDRGYAILTREDGSVVSAAAEVSKGDKVRARLAEGELGLTVDSIGS